jgi:hypothetical protein
MKKIDLAKVTAILKKHEPDAQKVRAMIEEMNLAAEKDSPDKEEGEPKAKKQFVIVVSDPAGRLPKIDLVGWVLQIPEDNSPSVTLDLVNRGAYEFNASKKGRLLPVKTHGEAFESVPPKFWKETGLAVKSKTPVLVVVTDNEIPKDGPSQRIDKVD